MAVYKSAMGKKIDMAALIAKNEKVRAVGNAKLNARGDIIDSQGKIVEASNNRVNKNYAQTVGNRSAHAVKRVPPKGNDVVKTTKGVNQKVEEFALTDAERELEESLRDDLEIEKIKQQENNVGSKTNVRRS